VPRPSHQVPQLMPHVHAQRQNQVLQQNHQMMPIQLPWPPAPRVVTGGGSTSKAVVSAAELGAIAGVLARVLPTLLPWCQ